ncbi:hypothetical protein, partial [Herbaspirillum sp. C9C3]|uniref:hypothetical protein n=1 Tax=Herbaspirillum sp. C9C3 TaxID=2735271 RepID=UPI001C2F5859
LLLPRTLVTKVARVFALGRRFVLMSVGSGPIPHKTVDYFIFSTAAPVVSPDYRAVLHLSFISPLNRPRAGLPIPASGTSLCFPQVTFPFRQNREDDLSTAVLAPSRSAAA